MKKIFDYKVKSKPVITHEDMKELGWIYKQASNVGNIISEVYEKDNYWVCFQEIGSYQTMTIIPKDPTKIEWLPLNPETFKIVIKRPTLEAFKAITAFI